MTVSFFKKGVAVLSTIGFFWLANGFADASPASEQVRFGVMVAKRGLWSEARFRFERAIALDPEYAAAHNNLAVALEQIGDFDGARQAYQKALDLKPKDKNIRQNFELYQDADQKRQRESDDRGSKKDAS
ncbi:MAG: tetratricopeptide repeat protein [Vicinamibacteria bacterium]|nr:tetratricopeptide repeat protein [Vicinamibacteria bacterium]